MKNLFLKTGDPVKIISGAKKGNLAIVVSLNKKHSLARILEEKKQEVIGKKKEDLSFFIHVSNLMVYDLAANKASRIGKKLIEKKKYRYFKVSGNLVKSS